ncbi:MAG: hypothetical protein ACU0CA_14330 [Paracoccaceae bacterium]
MGKYKSIDISSVLEIDDWYVIEEELGGSRVKQTVADPKTGQMFVFKEPKPRREAQIWSELLASFIAGDMLDWPVQHAQIAMRNGDLGNLLKYIFDPATDRLIMGEQFCKHIDPDYDEVQGTRHTWELIKRINSEFLGIDKDGNIHIPVSAAYFKFWARAIAFDTLISNTDRHAENWAVSLGPNCDLISPLYDNASSMGCEVEDVGLEKWFSGDDIKDAKIAGYVRRGCHHLRNGSKRFRFEELATQFLKEFPHLHLEFEEIANLSLLPVQEILDDISSLEGVPPVAQMNQRRRVQITRLLQEGQLRVIRALEQTR